MPARFSCASTCSLAGEQRTEGAVIGRNGATFFRTVAWSLPTAPAENGDALVSSLNWGQ